MSYIKKQFIKKTILGLVVVTGLFQYVIFSYFNHNLVDNIKIKIKGENIMYYDSQNDLMKYNSEEMKKYVFLFNTLKKYKKYKFYYNKAFNLDPFLILAHMHLNEISCMLTHYSDLETLEPDIIFSIGSQNVQVLMDNEISEMLLSPMSAKLVTKEFKKDLFKKIERNLCEILEKYHKIDEFYIHDNQNEDTKVTLFGRKDKFPDFSQ